MIASIRASTLSVLATMDCLGEFARTQRIHDGDLESAVVQIAMRQAMEFTRRLHDDEGDVEFGDGFFSCLRPAASLATTSLLSSG